MTVSGPALTRLVRAGVLDPVTATRIELEQLGIEVPDLPRREPVKNTYEVHTADGVAFTVEADRMETNGADSALLYAGDELVAVCPLGRLVGIKRVAWTVTAPGGVFPKAS